jgi:hypothetical protein
MGSFHENGPTFSGRLRKIFLIETAPGQATHGRANPGFELDLKDREGR